MKPIELTLECGHTLLMSLPYPNVDDTLWCVRCDDWSLVGPKEVQMVVSYWDGWTSEPLTRNIIRASCISEDGCTYTITGPFYPSRDKIEKHILHKHRPPGRFNTFDIEQAIMRAKEKPIPDTPPF